MEGVASGPRRIDCDVAVVGAGLSGLMAARCLAAQGVDVVVAEARDRVGGRLLSETVGDGTLVEHGGQYAGPTRVGEWRMRTVADALGVGMVETFDDGDRMLVQPGRTLRYGGMLPARDVLAVLEMGRAKTAFDRASSRLDPAAPWASAKAAEHDAQTLEAWMGRNLRTRRGRAVLRSVCEAIWGTDASELSLLHVLVYIRSVTGGHLKDLVAIQGGIQQVQLAGGAHALAQRLAEPLAERIVLEAPVTDVDDDGGAVTLHGPGLRLRARRAIVALPPNLAGRLRYAAPLPADRDQLTQRLFQGSVIKCTAVYERPFWRDQGLNGQVGATVGPVRGTFDVSPAGGPGVMQSFVVASEARRLARLPAAGRRDEVLAALAGFFGPEARRPVAYVEKDWSADPWSRGCFHCCFGPGAWTQLGHALRPAVGRLHWAGTETAVTGLGTMAGAVDAGERAAAAVLEAEPAIAGAGPAVDLPIPAAA